MPTSQAEATEVQGGWASPTFPPTHTHTPLSRPCLWEDYTSCGAPPFLARLGKYELQLGVIRASMEGA